MQITQAHKNSLSVKLYAEYLVEFEKAKAAFRVSHATGLYHMRKADEINLMRLALM